MDARRFRPVLNTLEDRNMPAFLTGAELVVGADAGSLPLVRMVNASTGNVDAQVLAFPASFTGGVRVAVGDVTGDGYPDLIAAAGPGGGPQVDVYDGQTGALVENFFAYDPGFAGGVYVAAGDVTGDGMDDIIVGSGVGGGPEVGVFDGATGSRLGGFFAYDPSVRGGVRVAAGNVTGGSVDDVVTGPGPGGGPDVRTFAFAGGTGEKLGGFYAFPGSFTGGVYVAAGDVNGDGTAEVVVGAGPGGGPQVVVADPTGNLLASFYAVPSSFTGGVRVATADLTGDGRDEVITGAGPGGGPAVSVFSLPGTDPVAAVFGFDAGQADGVFVAGTPKPLMFPTFSQGGGGSGQSDVPDPGGNFFDPSYYPPSFYDPGSTTYTPSVPDPYTDYGSVATDTGDTGDTGYVDCGCDDYGTVDDGGTIDDGWTTDY
jgi:hypothetical protein